jgi:hypothetical protein
MSDEAKPVAGAPGWRWPYPETRPEYIRGPVGEEVSLAQDALEIEHEEHDGLTGRICLPLAALLELLRQNGWKVTR